MSRTLLMLLLTSVGLAGCSGIPLEGSCGSQRSLTVADTLPNLSIYLQLVDEADRPDALSWEIRVQGLVNITAVHLHDGTPAGSGRMVYDFTTTDPDPQPDFTVAGSGAYSLNTGIENLFELVRSGRSYIDVHTSFNHRRRCGRISSRWSSRTGAITTVVDHSR